MTVQSGLSLSFSEVRPSSDYSAFAGQSGHRKKNNEKTMKKQKQKVLSVYFVRGWGCMCVKVLTFALALFRKTFSLQSYLYQTAYSNNQNVLILQNAIRYFGERNEWTTFYCFEYS